MQNSFWLLWDWRAILMSWNTWVLSSTHSSWWPDCQMLKPQHHHPNLTPEGQNGAREGLRELWCHGCSWIQLKAEFRKACRIQSIRGHRRPVWNQIYGQVLQNGNLQSTFGKAVQGSSGSPWSCKVFSWISGLCLALTASTEGFLQEQQEALQKEWVNFALYLCMNKDIFLQKNQQTSKPQENTRCEVIPPFLHFFLRPIHP